VTKTATLLGVSRERVYRVMSSYTNHWKTTSAKKNSGQKSTFDRKRLLYTKKSCFENSHNYCSTGDSRTEYSSCKTLLPQKLSDVSFTNPTFTVGLQMLKLRLQKAMLRCINNGVTTIKPGYQTTGKVHVIRSDVSSFVCSLHQEGFMFGNHPRKPTILNAWFQQ
jgi:hypothetical protein